jgi:hypothetical protein
VVTCRSDEAPLADVALGWLANARAAGATEVRLLPLSREEVAQQAVGLMGHAVPAGFVDELHARAEGHPFLTEQLVAAALAGLDRDVLAVPRQLPGGLVELLVDRVRQLGSAARVVLAALSVAARPLPESLLVAITGLDDPWVRDALGEFAAAALLAPGVGDGTCRPRHALLAEAVLTDLLPGELVAIHADTAQTLEATGDPALSAEVAAHWARAGRPMSCAPTRLVDTEQELFCGGLLVLGVRAAADLADRARARGDQRGEGAARTAAERLDALRGADGRPAPRRPPPTWRGSPQTAPAGSPRAAASPAPATRRVGGHRGGMGQAPAPAPRRVRVVALRPKHARPTVDCPPMQWCRSEGPRSPPTAWLRWSQRSSVSPAGPGSLCTQRTPAPWSRPAAPTTRSGPSSTSAPAPLTSMSPTSSATGRRESHRGRCDRRTRLPPR